jgi:hypothetical protein
VEYGVSAGGNGNGSGNGNDNVDGNDNDNDNGSAGETSQIVRRRVYGEGKERMSG